jgi:hypothetical protein
MQPTLIEVGPAPRISLGRVAGDLIVQQGEPLRVLIESDSRNVFAQFLDSEHGSTLTLGDCEGDLRLSLPADATLLVGEVEGDSDLSGIRRVELQKVEGSLQAERIAEALVVGEVQGDLSLRKAAHLQVSGLVHGDVKLEAVETVEIEMLEGDLSLESSSRVLVGALGGDADLLAVTGELHCGSISGDAVVRAGPDSRLVVGSIGGDLKLTGAASVRVGTVDGDVVLRGIAHEAEIGQIEGDLDAQGIAGRLEVGVVDGDAVLKGVRGALEIGAIGDDLFLEAAFAAGSQARLNVGGDAFIDLPADVSLTLRALVGGDVSGEGLIFSGERWLQLIYGDGAARLDIKVAGDLRLRGKARPRDAGRTYRPWEEFERDMQEFAAAMAGLGPELAREWSRMAEELLDNLHFADVGKGQQWRWREELARRLDEQARRAQRSAETWRQRFARFRDRAPVKPRVRVRLHEHEWRMDPERLRRIMEEAQRAATEGVTGALEAVAHALQNLGVTVPPSPSPSTATNEPPTARPAEPPTAAAVSPSAPTTQEAGHTTRQEGEQQPEQTTPPEPLEGGDQEREAILRMVAEGRLSTEEGDMLLEALDD